MVSFLENPVIYLVLHLCSFKTPTSWAVMSEEGDADCALKTRNGVKLFGKEDKTKLQWTDNDIHLYSPDTPPSCELYPKKRGGSVSPPILKQGTYGMGNLRFPYDASLS